jgi:hypothetical protein
MWFFFSSYIAANNILNIVCGNNSDILFDCRYVSEDSHAVVLDLSHPMYSVTAVIVACRYDIIIIFFFNSNRQHFPQFPIPPHRFTRFLQSCPSFLFCVKTADSTWWSSRVRPFKCLRTLYWASTDRGLRYSVRTWLYMYCILASCYIRFTLNICSFVHQCNTFTLYLLLFGLTRASSGVMVYGQKKKYSV